MTQADKERYTRQIALAEMGEDGQKRLASASVLIVGVGGLGSPIATLLVSSGVGRIGIVDYDMVSLSNLPRQTLYTTEDIGLSKVECATRRLMAMNPSVKIECHNTKFDDSSAEEIMRGYDIVVDGCDNMPTRYVIDRWSQKLGMPYIYGAINGFVGQVSVFNHLGSGSYSDLFPQDSAVAPSAPPPVMSTTPALIGAIEAGEVFKIIVGYGSTLAHKLLTFDSRSYELNIYDI
ncbi:MAG: HesA/MoeB/ThiF family protein [Rikenellaceae bacterium]